RLGRILRRAQLACGDVRDRGAAAVAVVVGPDRDGNRHGALVCTHGADLGVGDFGGAFPDRAVLVFRDGIIFGGARPRLETLRHGDRFGGRDRIPDQRGSGAAGTRTGLAIGARVRRLSRGDQFAAASGRAGDAVRPELLWRGFGQL